METSTEMKSISDSTLEELFPETLTDTSCVYIDKGREVWVGTEMCAQYIESNVDSIVVIENNKALGIIGGYDILDHLRKNPTRDFQYHHKVEEVMFKELPQIEKNIKFEDLIDIWKNSRRAFAVIPRESGDYSPISARKMLELGTRCQTDISVSSIPKKRIVTFSQDDSLGKVIELMIEHKTRKLLLENSKQFISDRIILGHISHVNKFEKETDNYLDIPIKNLCLEYVNELKEDVKFNKLCAIMDKMGHPFVIYKDTPISPWDVCLTIKSEDMSLPIAAEYQKIATCPHCGKDID
jgi:predicted transcriptional regulator